MGLDFAVDQLYSTGWAPLDTRECDRLTDGRAYPTVSRVEAEFASAGLSLTVRHIQLFDCFKAEWSEADGGAAGSVVGQSEAEAAVYALSQMRRGVGVLAGA